MGRITNIGIGLSVGILLLILVGCAAKTGLTVNAQQGVLLQYQANDTTPLMYQYTHEFNQKFEVAGNRIETSGTQTALYTVTPAPGDDNLELSVRVEDAGFDATAPTGEITADLSPIIGREFVMLLSPQGKELDMGAADSINFELAGETRSLAFELGTFFPDLPDHALKIGENWNSADTIRNLAGVRDLTIILNHQNKLMGVERVAGRECLRVNTTSSGELSGKGERDGVPIATIAQIKSNDVWYFDPVAGVYVKSESSGTAEGNIEIAGPQPMTLPMQHEFSYRTSLVE